MIRDFIKTKNIKSDDFLYTIVASLYYHSAYTTTACLYYHNAYVLPQCLKLRGKLLPRFHINKDFFLESVYLVLDFREF